MPKPKARITNNSVSNLEEQTLLIRIMADSASGEKSKPAQQDEKKQRSSKRRGPASPKSSAEPKPPAGREREPLGEEDIVSIAGGTEPRKDDSVSIQSQAEGVFHDVPQMQPLPYFFGPQQFPGYFAGPQMNHYGGFAGPYGFPNHNHEWDLQSVSSRASLSDRQGAHEISDEEEEEGTPAIVEVENVAAAKPELDVANMKEGKMAELLKAEHKKAKEGDKVGPKVDGNFATILDDYLEETKVAGEMEKLAKEYPRIRNIEKLVVPRLDSELFTAVDQNARAADVTLQNVQKGIVGAISALAPIGSLMAERGNSDPELEAFCKNMMDGLHLLILANNSVSGRRREQLKPLLQHTYRNLGKNQDASPEWLFGGNLSESTRKCELVKKLGEKIIKRKNTPNTGTNFNQKQGAYGGQQQNKRFRGPTPAWQQGNQKKVFGYQHFYPQMGYPQQQQQQFQSQNFQAQYRPKGPNGPGQQQPQQQQQGFQKKGPRF